MLVASGDRAPLEHSLGLIQLILRDNDCNNCINAKAQENLVKYLKKTISQKQVLNFKVMFIKAMFDF